MSSFSDTMTSSIVLATCNGAQYLQEQLSSIAAQTRQPQEVIVSDDASDDNTLDILQGFAKRAPFNVRVFVQQARLGYAQNFSHAAMLAVSDIILFCDQDDIWDPRKIETIEAFFATHPNIACVAHNIAIVDSEGRELRSSYFSYLLQEHRSTQLFVKGCATAIRRELRDVAFPLLPGSAWSHDAWVHAWGLITGKRSIISEVLSQYRIHERNTSGYVPRRRSKRSIPLAMLDQLAIGRMPEWAIAFLLGSHCEPQAIEKAHTAMAEFAGTFIASRASIGRAAQWRETLTLLRHDAKSLGKISACIHFLRAYGAGAYNSFGGLFALLADVCRIATGTHSAHPKVSP